MTHSQHATQGEIVIASKAGGREKHLLCRSFKISGSNLACAPFFVSFSFRFSAVCMSELLRAEGRELIKDKCRPTTDTIEEDARQIKSKIIEECSKGTVRKSRCPR